MTEGTPKRARRSAAEIYEEKRLWILRHEWHGRVNALKLLQTARETLHEAIENARSRPLDKDLDDAMRALIDGVQDVYTRMRSLIPSEALNEDDNQ